MKEIKMMDEMLNSGMLESPKMMRHLIEMGREGGLDEATAAEYKAILNGPEDEVAERLKRFVKALKRKRDEEGTSLPGAAKSLDDIWRIPHHTDTVWRDADGSCRRKRSAFGQAEPGLAYTYDDRIRQDESCRPYFQQVRDAGFDQDTPRFYEELLCLVEGHRVELRHVLCQLDRGYLIMVLGFREPAQGEEESHEKDNISEGESAS